MVEFSERDIPVLTEVVDSSDNITPTFQHSISMSAISDNELELQQWQIEQQAIAQRSDWQALGQMASVSSSEANVETSDDTKPVEATITEPLDPESSNTESIELTNDQQRILDASWQRLEAFLMEQMPPEIAGTYLSVIEQQIQQSRSHIGRDLSLLDEDSIESLLDFYQIDRGF